jgi:hypothetical protein
MSQLASFSVILAVRVMKTGIQACIFRRQRVKLLYLAYRLQEFVFFDAKLLENVGEKVRTNTFAGVNRDRRAPTVPMMEYGMRPLLAHFFESELV